MYCNPTENGQEDFQNLLRPAARYAILKIEKEEAREAATLNNELLNLR